jgi:hypothetical protein
MNILNMVAAPGVQSRWATPVTFAPQPHFRIYSRFESPQSKPGDLSHLAVTDLGVVASGWIAVIGVTDKTKQTTTMTEGLRHDCR